MAAVQAVTFKIPTPPSVNNLFINLRRRGRVCTEKYAAWKRDAGYLLLAQRPKKMTGPITATIIYPDEGRADLDNLCKAVLDLAVTHGVITGDGRAIVRKLSLEWGNVTETVVTFTRAVTA